MPTIMGSTTLSAKSAATAASTALPPAASISPPAAEASGWLVTTMPRAACTGRFSVSNRVPARARQVIGASGARPARAAGGLSEKAVASSFREPGVPEVEAGGGAEGAAQLAAGHVEREVVAELHAAHVLVEDRLDAVDQRLALLGIVLATQLGHELLLLLVAPAAPPAAADGDVVGGVGGEDEAGGGHLPQLGLERARVEGGPVHDLQVDVEADPVELLLGDLRVLVHELVLARGHPADRLLGIAGFGQQPLRLVGVVLVVEVAAHRRVPGLLGEEEAGVEAVERLVAEAADHDRLHVERGLEGLAQLLVRHGAGLVVQHGDRPAARLDDARVELGQRLDAVVGVLLHEHRVVVLARLHA